MCNNILHKKCKSENNIVKFREQTYCISCINTNDIIRYNPFYQASHFASNGLIDEEPVNYIESLATSSTILENCHSYSIQELNTNPLLDNNNVLSTFFLNIDGNASNFDSLTAEIHRLDHKFGIIGLAETNTDPENGNLYPMPGYSSCYQSRFFFEDKSQFKNKGTGVCLYIKNSLNYNKINDLSQCTDCIESLFLNITNLPEETVVGVIYRPPNASLDKFNKAYEEILSRLRGKNSYILGDFNVNLLKTPTPTEESFQEVIYSNGFIPTISVPTHQMPNCSKTCIDNIHTNVIESSLMSGVS